MKAIADEPAYQPREDSEARVRHRNPRIKTLVRLAMQMQCDSAEQLGAALKRRYERRKRRRLDAQVDRMLDRGRAE